MSLFGTAGIRGLVGKRITTDMAFALGRSIVLSGETQPLLACDARISSPFLKSVVAAGMTAQGADLIDYDRLSFPEFAWATRQQRCAGIYLTASHNPPEYNGFKFLRCGREYTASEEMQIEQHYDRLILKQRREAGSGVEESSGMLANGNIFNVDNTWIRLQYEKQLVGVMSRFEVVDPVEVVVDAANGMTSLVTPRILTSLGHIVRTVNCHEDGSFPGRLAEPKPSNLGTLTSLCKSQGMMGIAHDGDGDRVAFITKHGEFVDLSRAIALMATIIAEQWPPSDGNGVLIASIDTSLVIDQVLSDLLPKSEEIRTRLGYLIDEFLECKKRGSSCFFMSEPWKPIFPEWGTWIDGVFAATLVVSYLGSKGIALSEALESIPELPHKRADFVVDDKRAVFDAMCNWIEQNEEVLSVNESDGRRYSLSDETWVLVRMSGTENKVRVYSESSSHSRIDGILQRLTESMHSI